MPLEFSVSLLAYFANHRGRVSSIIRPRSVAGPRLHLGLYEVFGEIDGEYFIDRFADIV